MRSLILNLQECLNSLKGRQINTSSKWSDKDVLASHISTIYYHLANKGAMKHLSPGNLVQVNDKRIQYQDIRPSEEFKTGNKFCTHKQCGNQMYQLNVSNSTTVSGLSTEKNDIDWRSWNW